MDATLKGNTLGALWSCGITGNGTLQSTEGATAITSEMYDWTSEFEKAES